MTQHTDGAVVISTRMDGDECRKGLETLQKQIDSFTRGTSKDFAALSKVCNNVSVHPETLLDEMRVLEDAAARAGDGFAALAGGSNLDNLETQIRFMKDAAELAGDYGLAVEKQNQLIGIQAARYRELFAGKPELLEMVDIWEKFQKRAVSDSWEDGFSRAAQKYNAEWTNAAKIAERTFDATVTGMENIGMAGFDALFDNAEFRADKLLKDMARSLYQIGLRSVIGNLFGFAGFSDGGYTGGGPTNDVAGVVHGQEYVLNAAATKSIGVGTLNALNATGSLAAAMGDAPAYRSLSRPDGGGSGMTVNVINNAPNTATRQERSVDGNGNVRLDVVVDELVAGRISRGGATARALEQRYGLSGRTFKI